MYFISRTYKPSFNLTDVITGFWALSTCKISAAPTSDEAILMNSALLRLDVGKNLMHCTTLVKGLYIEVTSLVILYDYKRV